MHTVQQTVTKGLKRKQTFLISTSETEKGWRLKYCQISPRKCNSLDTVRLPCSFNSS